MQAAGPPGSPPSRPSFGVVAMAASAGGLKALTTILSGLDAGFPAPILVVQHLDRAHPSLMAQILDRRTALSVTQARSGETIRPGHAYIAPPDYHLLVDDRGTLSLTHTALVRFVRPSADILFTSVAASFGNRAIAVVVTGSGSDGAAGVREIKRLGGTVVVQDQASSEFFGMPGAAIGTGDVDFVLPLAEIAGKLAALVCGVPG